MPQIGHFSCFEAFRNPSPLMAEFQTKIYFIIWVLVMKYIESLSHLEVWNYDFKAKTVSTGILATYGSTQTLKGVGDT